MTEKKPIRKFSPKQSAENIRAAIEEGRSFLKVAEEAMNKKEKYQRKRRD